jgi:hypothetical protein
MIGCNWKWFVVCVFGVIISLGEVAKVDYDVLEEVLLC